MFKFAVLIGFYSYSLFGLGVIGLLTPLLVFVLTVAFLSAFLYFFKRNMLQIGKYLTFAFEYFVHESLVNKFLWIILATQMMINLIGALGPESGFDAIWYHLTLPKIYIEQKQIAFIPGGLFYYSAMPKLIEMLYIPALMFGNEIFAKLIHFSFGFLTLVVLFRLSKMLLPKNLLVLVLVVFYSNLVVAWQSTTAYIDLGRTFFEVLSLYFLILFFKTKKNTELLKSGVSLGLSIGSKVLSIGSLIPVLLILFAQRVKFLRIIQFIFLCLIIPLPWFIFSYINTGNPIYPFFSSAYSLAPSLNILNFTNLARSSDPISPAYLITLPLILLYFKKFNKFIKVVAVYSFLSLIVWIITPQTGGGRFILPYLPAYSILVGSAIYYSKNKLLKGYLVILVVLVALTSLVYRGIANSKYVPVVLGLESKHHFLSKNLNYNFGDFYDAGRYFENNIDSEDKVLIYGTHNLFYVNFPFIHESFVKKKDMFNYIMTQNVDIPSLFSDWKLIYVNSLTNVKLYTKDKKLWEY